MVFHFVLQNTQTGRKQTNLGREAISKVFSMFFAYGNVIAYKFYIKIIS